MFNLLIFMKVRHMCRKLPRLRFTFSFCGSAFGIGLWLDARLDFTICALAVAYDYSDCHDI